MQHYFLINEVAQIHNMSKKTLLYYDKVGIFVPHKIDEETGYRYYIREQFPYLKQIIYLKKLGFSLDEIKELLDNRHFDTLLDKLKIRLQEVELEIENLIDVKKDLDYLIDFYEQIQFIDERDLYKPGIKLFNKRRVMYEWCEEENSSEGVMLAYRKMLRTLMDLGVFSQMAYGTICQEPVDNDGYYYDKIGSFISLPLSFGLENELIQERGKYAYMYKKGGYYDEESVAILLDWIKENGYTAIGNIYDYSLIDYTFTNSDEEMIQEIQVRIV